MNARTAIPSSLQQRIVGAIVSLALVLQGLLVPLHLTWYDHIHVGEAPEHTHAHAEHSADGHWHGPEHVDSVDLGSEHRPHPVDDHQDRPTEVAPAFGSSSAGLAALPADAIRPSRAVAPRSIRVDDAYLRPRPPPERTRVAPRAPPVAV